jgi:TRAP-type C4-dicarboxylate transport system permease small subunit
MFKKVLLIISLLLILIGNQATSPSKDYSLINGSSFLKIHHNNIAFAAENGQPASKEQNQAVTSSWVSYIVPVTVGIVLIFSIGSYWLVIRKKEIKKEA